MLWSGDKPGYFQEDIIFSFDFSLISSFYIIAFRSNNFQDINIKNNKGHVNKKMKHKLLFLYIYIYVYIKVTSSKMFQIF